VPDETTPRDSAGRPICWYCREPLPVVRIKGRAYGLCHGAFHGLLTADIPPLEEYARRKAAK
jgi:hypothetical protein